MPSMATGSGSPTKGGAGALEAPPSDRYPEPQDAGEEEDFSDEDEGLVLHPDHRLMQRAQLLLKKQLVNRKEKLDLDLREREEELKTAKKKREDIGVELYGVQQQLARQQVILEKAHDQHNAVLQIRLQFDEKLKNTKEDNEKSHVTARDQQKALDKYQLEFDKLNTTLRQIDSYNDEKKAEIAITKRATQKAEEKVQQLQTDKKKQDILVDRLTQQVKEAETRLAALEAQHEAQGNETRKAADTLAEANNEMEAIVFEKKQLLQQWQSSLIGMRRRDEALSSVHNTLNKHIETKRALDNEIIGFKQSVKKEQEQNETFTILLNKVENEVTILQRQISTIQEKNEKTKETYTMYTKSLHKTEAELQRVVEEKGLLQKETNSFVRETDDTLRKQQQIEDEVLGTLQNLTTVEKYSQHTKKSTKQLRDSIRNQQHQISSSENDLSRQSLGISNLHSRIGKQKAILQDAVAELQAKGNLVTKYESEIRSKHDHIKKKQSECDKQNRKYDAILQKIGGDVNYGPMEAVLNNLSKSIEQKSKDNAELQQYWLRSQNELVGIMRDGETESEAVEEARGQIIVLTQKKRRLMNDLAEQEADIKECRLSTTALQNDMVKLNHLIAKNTGAKDELDEGNLLLANEFVHKLKDAELESVQLETKVSTIKVEKKRILESLVEAERQVMLWEKKIQLARETRATLNPEVGANEIRSMRSEIHRMKLRFSQLEKEQEKMIKEMEKSILRRESISSRVQNSPKGKGMTKAMLKKRVAELQKKLKQTIDDTQQCEHSIRELVNMQNQVAQNVEEATSSCRHLQQASEKLERQAERMTEEKKINLFDITRLQRLSKRYAQAKEGKYKLIAKSEEHMEEELGNQIDRMNKINAVLDTLMMDFPHLQKEFGALSNSMASQLRNM